MEKSFEAGDHLVLSVPVVRAVENDPWSTVTFSLANGQWVTIRQDAKEIIKTLKGPADAVLEGAKRRERVQASSVRRGDNGQTTLGLNIESGPSEFERSDDELVRLAAKVVSEAGRLAAGANHPPLEAGAALSASAVSVDGHPTETSSAILAIEVGRLKLSFELEASALLQAIKLFLDRRKSARSNLDQSSAEPAAAAGSLNGRNLDVAAGDG